MLFVAGIAVAVAVIVSVGRVACWAVSCVTEIMFLLDGASCTQRPPTVEELFATDHPLPELAHLPSRYLPPANVGGDIVPATQMS